MDNEGPSLPTPPSPSPSPSPPPLPSAEENNASLAHDQIASSGPNLDENVERTATPLPISDKTDDDNNISRCYKILSEIKQGASVQNLQTNTEDGTDNTLDSNFLDLIHAAETVLNLTLDRTANESCDTKKLNFVDFCGHLISLTNFEECKYHAIFLPYVIKWMDQCRKFLIANDAFTRQSMLDSSREGVKNVLSATCCLLSYLSSILDVLKFTSSVSAEKQSVEDDQNYQANSQIDWTDEGPCSNLGDDDEDSLVDDSDDESLCNKLCTFTSTHKQFINQHWYHCHTCNMSDTAGVCTICAKVCHKDHDVSYAKFGAFFCDCAGRENSSCIALVKRTTATTSGELNYESISNSMRSKYNVRVRKLCSSKSSSDSHLLTGSLEAARINPFEKIANQLEPHKSELLAIISNSDCCSIIQSILSSLIPAYVSFAHSVSQIGRIRRAEAALKEFHNSRKDTTIGSNPAFPVDFFEDLQVLNEIEYGGQDLLSIYNTQQIKNRLNSSGMYVACTKPQGFCIDILNNDPNMVICGIRVHVGVHELSKSPSSIEILGRTIQIHPLTPRWYDLPLTREESIQADKRLTVVFGPSTDSSRTTLVDMIKVYGKSKESFSWPEDGEEQTIPANVVNDDLFGLFLGRDSGFCYQKLLAYSMESLEYCLHLNQCRNLDRSQLEKIASELSTSLLTVPYPPQLSKTIKSFLLTVYTNRQNYKQHRDSAALNFVVTSLISFQRDNQEHLDWELCSRVISVMKSLCQSDLSHLVKINECLDPSTLKKTHDYLNLSQDEYNSYQKRNKLFSLLHYVNNLILKLGEQKPKTMNVMSVTSRNLFNYEDTLQPLIELIFIASLHDLSILPGAVRLLTIHFYREAEHSLFTRHTLIRLLRNKGLYQSDVPKRSVAKPTVKRIETCPTTNPSTLNPAPHHAHPRACPPVADLNASSAHDRFEPILEQEPLVCSQNSSIASQSGHVLRGQADSTRQENEDDIAIAIALSLQDDSQNNSVTDNAVTAAPTTSGRSDLNLLSDRMPSAEELMSDTTASGVASDEELSTSGSKPAQVQQDSTNQSIDGVQTSLTQEVANSSCDKASYQTKQDQQYSADVRTEKDDQQRLIQHHAMFLYELINQQYELEEADLDSSRATIGAISYYHVILILTLDLESENELDPVVLKELLSNLRSRLMSFALDGMSERSGKTEVKLVVMRMFSILMSKIRPQSVTKASIVEHKRKSQGIELTDFDVIGSCYSALKDLLNYWRSTTESDSTRSNSCILPSSAKPAIRTNRKRLPLRGIFSQFADLSPFFSRQYVKENRHELFEDYHQLVTEMALRIPYQIKKISNSTSKDADPIIFSSDWSTILCEFLMIPIPSHIKKHVRKLLTFICGSKDKYRQLRDSHFLDSHMASVKSICGYTDDNEDASKSISTEEIKITCLNYESMTSLVEHLKSCIEIAQNRCINWQIYCLLKDQTLLASLMKIALNFGDDVSSIILELLQHALNSTQASSGQSLASLMEAQIVQAGAREEISDQTLKDTLTSESLGSNLAQQLINSISKQLLSKFIQCFLLETNLTSLRWQAHSLLHHLWLNSMPNQQLGVLRLIWSLWHNLPMYGSKASQFVDLIGYITLKSPQCGVEYERMFCQEALNVLKQQNELLINHPNAHIYSSIQGLVDLDSYYLESEPCPVCNSPEVPYSTIKLGSIKVDSRFTTTTQIVKLIGSQTIQRFSLRISDIKRSKMVKTISVYYNNRSVQSVVELKNKTGIWNLARKYALLPSQTDVKIEFTLPIVACNLMIEFSDFYENFQASSETLQCPRCSTSVPANPGVCSNCGENVFQCHKCRAINYDEKDPFLCISCGFCKYARFDISLTAKPTCSVDPIENEDDRKKTVATISHLLEKADRVYKNLVQNKPTLELLLLRIHEQVVPDYQIEENTLVSDSNSFSIGSSVVNPIQPSSLQAQSIVVGYAPTSGQSALTSSVNKAIQHLAQKYCVECKGLFEELSKITHKILASRRELVEYDNRQLKTFLNAGSSILSSANMRKSRVYSSLTSGSGRCYGCATASVEHCVTMLKALSTIPKLRTQICESGIIGELVNFNLRNGSSATSQEVRQLLCSLIRDDLASTTILTDLLMGKISAISRQDFQPFEVSHIVRHEIALLSVTLDSDDKCWELRLRCLIKIFAFAYELKNPAVMECLIIPCLRLLLSIIKPPAPTTRRHKDKSLENIATVRSDKYKNRIPLREWLSSSEFIFEDWRRRAARPVSLAQGNKQIKPITSIVRRPTKVHYRSNYLAEKYGNRWRLKSSKYNKICQPIESLPNDWLKRLLFNRASKTVRLMAKSIVEALFAVQSRRGEIIDLLTSYLCEIGPAGECAQEFYYLYKNIILSDHWRFYLALKGVLIKISGFMELEIDKLQELEETTLTSSLSLGYSLRMLLELMTAFVTVPRIRSRYKTKLVGCVLKGYLSLRKLVVQRTKVIDETQEMLLELLEGMTTGSESETAAFIDVCVEAIKDCNESDIRTPVFIFERICSTIHPEGNIHSEFFVSLEKDPQQEDYLQGRMLGNPYSSNEPGIGPLMKDIKNKICQDCELLALLEDDSSMELLVSNKIISLDLPVRDVFYRVWVPENHESDAMRIVYRMRGLLGDATEEFIERLDSRECEEVDDEQAYKMANIMSSSGGLEIMLQRLKQIDDLSPPFKALLDVILKLFVHCTKTKNNRLHLIRPELKTVATLLDTLKIALNEDEFLKAADLTKGVFSSEASLMPPSNKQHTTSAPAQKTQIIDQILLIIETISREATKQPKPEFDRFRDETCGSVEDLEYLMNVVLILNTRLPHVSHKILQALTFLTLGDQTKMTVLVGYFEKSIFNMLYTPNTDTPMIELFCTMVGTIEQNEIGNQLKDYIVYKEVVRKCAGHLTRWEQILATPPDGSALDRPDLRYALRILQVMSQGHPPTQIFLAERFIPIIHGLEQVSSDARVGSLAESLLETIKQHPLLAEKIELVRRQTREQKKKLAMAVRERQLGALGMKANERGQVTLFQQQSKLYQLCQDLAEDTGLICNICREGYKFLPTKVLGIYTYTKRCILDEFEAKPRKTYGYTTVTHFNTIHIECHMSAVRSARGRDEWDSAALQNANTRCNGLLPIWGPQVPESAYANALARHNSYLQDSTGYRNIDFDLTLHDIRYLLLRFAQERSFSEDTGGGGPQSNLHLLPYLMQTALYVLNSTKAAAKEYKSVLSYLKMDPDEILKSCYDVNSPYYWTSLALLVLPPVMWKKKRVQFLGRLLICNHVRRANIRPPPPISDTRIRAYTYYKSALIFFALIDSFYGLVFKNAVSDDKCNQEWSVTLADYLRHNDQIINDNIEVLLNLYQNALLTCTSLESFFEIVRVEEISQPSEFLAKTLESV